jgi:crossover junction endodeoxyribonuclease RusA
MVPDDIPRWMSKPEPIIHPAERGKIGALWLEITWTEED